MTALQYVLSIVIILLSIGISILVLMQESKQQGLSGAISGAAETFFGKNKNNTLEGKLALATKVSSIVFVALAILMLIIG